MLSCILDLKLSVCIKLAPNRVLVSIRSFNDFPSLEGKLILCDLKGHIKALGVHFVRYTLKLI